MPQRPVTIPQQRRTDSRPATAPETVDHPPAATGTTCPCCGSERLTSLAMTLTDGTPVSFTSCRSCEHRTWAHEGGALRLSDVLSRASKQLQG